MRADLSLPSAIVLGADSAIGLTVIRELGRHGVPVIAIGRSRHAVGRSSRYTSKYFIRQASEPIGNWLPGVVRETGAAVLFAISEEDLLELANLPPNVEGCRILTPRKRQLDIVLDKAKTLDAAQSIGILTPETWQPVAGEAFAMRAQSLSYPVVLKWADPTAMLAVLDKAKMAFEKVEYAQCANELLNCLNRYNPIGAYPMVQSWCEGFGFGQMMMMADGVARLRFQHRRLREYPATGGISTLCTSVPQDRHREQMVKSEALLASIGWEGPAMVEYRYNPVTEQYWLMEVNGRFWGSLPLASQSGAEFAWEQYRFAVLDARAVMHSTYRVRRARYAIPDSKRLLQVLKHTKLVTGSPALFGKVREVFSYIGEFFNLRTGYYVWSWSDPAPLFRDLLGIASKLGR